MTSKVKIEHIGGNRPVSVTDANGHSVGVLGEAGRSIEVTVSGGVSFVVGEPAIGSASMGGEPGSNIPDVRILDGGGAA